jgi:hypothetical protein
MSTELHPSSRRRAVIGLAAAALLAAGLLSSRVMSHQGLSSGMHVSTTYEKASNFVASSGMVPDSE